MTQKRPQSGQQEPQQRQKLQSSTASTLILMIMLFVALCIAGGVAESISPTTRRGIFTNRQEQVVGGYQVILKHPTNGGETWAHVKDEYINAAEVGDTVEVLQGVMRKVEDGK